MRRMFVGFCVAALMLLTAGQAGAATIRIEFDNLDLVFDGHELVDAVSSDGGIGDPSLADPLATLDFFLDGAHVSSLTSGIWADVAIFGVEDIPVAGGVVNAQGGGFDLLTGPSGYGLGLDLNDVQLFYFGGELAISGVASADIFAEILPFNLVMTGPVDVLFVLGPLTNVTSAGGFLTGFAATGTGSVEAAGAAVPEPATLLLLGAGLIAGAAGRRRRPSR